MSWGVQVKVKITKAPGTVPVLEWRWLRPSGGEPYEFANKAEADRVKDMCYPLATPNDVRVREFPEEGGNAEVA